LVLAVGAASGCGAWDSLRALFHGEQPEAVEFGKAGLRVEVEPPVGISIIIDGVRVGSSSPYVNRKLRQGPHRLEVRAMGYHSVTLPVELVDGEVLTVPVSLRERAPGNEGSAGDATDADSSAAAPLPPETPAPPLPPGVAAITLTLAPQPTVPILLDGLPVEGRQVRIERVSGEIQVGVLNLRFTVGGAGNLTLFVPADGATYSKQNAKLAAGGSFKLPRGAVRLRRVAEDGTDQAVVIRR
jgi:hypothetical protein